MRSKNILRKPFKYTYVNAVMYLIAINIFVFFIDRYLITTGIINLKKYFALIPFLTIDEGMFWQVFTYQFMHGGIRHIFFNMLSLFFFGPALERKMGSKEFIMFYLLCGTLCGVINCFIYYFLGFNGALIGASGAIFAVLLCYSVLFPDTEIYLWFVLPVPTPILIIGFFIFELLSIFSDDNIGHLAHLLGLLIAWLYIRFRFGISPLKAWGFKKQTSDKK